VRFSEGTHRLHWATVPIRMCTIMIIYFVLLGFPLLLAQIQEGGRPDLTSEELTLVLMVTVPFMAASVVAGLWVWLALRFHVDGGEDDLVVETGLLRKKMGSFSIWVLV
jgi:hypothetical protein